MKRNVKNFLKAAGVAIGTGLYLLDHSDKARHVVRERVNDQVDELRDRLDDLRDRASDTYDVAADRVVRAAKVLRGDEDSGAIWNMLRFAVGLGIGAGIGLLFAPANGEATRARLSEKAQEFGDNVRQRFAADLRATGAGD